MDGAATITLLVLIFAVAVLYSAIGLAGASGYLAAMALVGMSPEAMKPTALVLNVLVALIATVRFSRAGCFSWPLLWPFALGSIPFSFAGGALALPSPVYRTLVAVLLLFAGVMLFCRPEGGADGTLARASVTGGITTGAVVGLLSGMIGIGGGILLSPVVLLKGWAGSRETSGLAAPFILVNSIAALTGHYLMTGFIPAPAPLWAVAAALGGTIGAGLGSRKLSATTIRRVLALILVIAAIRMILTAIASVGAA